MTTMESLTNLTPDGAHPLDETLVRLIDGEVLVEEQAAAAHATTCSACQARTELLKRRRARLTELLTATDAPAVPVPNAAELMAIAAGRTARHTNVRPLTAKAPSVGRPSRRPTRRTLAAAVLVLSGAALAAQPVSRWVVARWHMSDVPAPTPPATSAGSEPVSSPAAISFVPQPGEFTIRFDAVPTAGHLTLRAGTSPKVDADITADAKDEGFFVLPDGLRIRNSATSLAEYDLTLPPSLTRVRVQIGTGAAERTLVVRLQPGQTQRLSLVR